MLMMNKLKRWTSIVLLILSLQWVIQPGFVSATTIVEPKGEVCFQEPAAKAILSELKTNREFIDEQRKEIDLQNKEIDLLDQARKVIEEKNMNLEKDKQDLKIVASDLEKIGKKCQENLQKCEESKPSRLTWFGVGFVSAIIVSVVGAFFISR